MQQKCYSANEEEYYSDIELAVEYAFDYPDAKPGDVRTIWEGDAVQPKASQFSPRIDWLVEGMNESACEVYDEWAEDWPPGEQADIDDLEKMIKAAIDAWADKHNAQPTFFMAENSREIKVILTEDNYEIR